MKRLLPLAFPALIVLLTLLAGESGASKSPRARDARPNVIVVMTDDQTIYELAQMPNVERYLVRAGTSFDNAFVNYPLCCPSRATFLTGRYSHNTGVVGNTPTLGYDRFDQAHTLPVWLRRVGYTTIMVGKYLNGYGRRAPRYVPPGWNDWHALVTLRYQRYGLNDNGTIHYHGDAPVDYQTDVLTRKALAAVARATARGRPFFLWLAYFAPHDGPPIDRGDPSALLTPSPPPRTRGLFGRVALPRTPSFNEVDVSDKPLQIRRRKVLDPEVIAAVGAKYRQRLRSLVPVDEGVGKLVRQLARRKELARTIIVFTSDNGFVLGQHRLPTGKDNQYEPSIRVPLVVRGPGVPRGVRLSQPVVNADLAPTILEAAGARPTLSVDGRSLLPLFADPTLEWGREILIERGPGQAQIGPRRYTGLHTPRYAYVEHATGERELYDLVADPDELTNLASDPASAPVVADLSARLRALRDCSGAACRRGPALAFSVAAEGGCAAPVVRARLGGSEQRLVQSVDFIVGKRHFPVAAAPFEQTVPRSAATATAPLRVRALAVLSDGRRVTLDRQAPACNASAGARTQS